MALVVVKFSETYDLHTVQDKVGMIGIHTPTSGMIQLLYSGLWDNYKFVKVKSCDVSMACASMLPADPLQVGVETGDIHPADMFNPILYRPVSNDSFNSVLARMYGLSDEVALEDLGGSGSIKYLADAFDRVPHGSGSSAIQDYEQKLYYGLLADPSWRKAMPQMGLRMKGLFPIVYELLNNYGNILIPSSAGSLNQIPAVINKSESTTQYNQDLKSLANTFRGRGRRMPALPTWSGKQITTGIADATEQSSATSIPRTYVGCIIMPPAKLNLLYYRLRITWYIEFKDVCTTNESGKNRMRYIVNTGASFYGSDYNVQSKSMDELGDSIDTRGLPMEKIMTSGA